MYKDNQKKSLLTKVILIMILFVISCLVIMFQQYKQKEVVKIGIIDSVLEDKYLSEYNVIYAKKVSTDTQINDHGSSVLSIIKQENDAQIYYASILDSKLEANINDVANAIYWCIKNNVDIINMSFATTEDNPLLKEAIQYALSKNIIIVASCINYYDGYSYPAMYNGVVSVSNGDFSKSTLVVKKQIYKVKLLNGNVIKNASTSCATAYVTNQISLELAGKRKECVANLIQD
ncbi:MAG: S8 family serine peptidase [Clostridia bacterium]|nr:S8 family serine peptidase [Clostridia bacterium]MDD4386579.1 S8 family serine peptidase [Clostridia bacterium]